MSWNLKRAVIGTLAALTLTTAVQAEEIHVPRDYPSLWRALLEAQDGDEIVLADGVWTGYNNLELSFDDKRLTLRSLNGPENCIINGEGELTFLRVSDARTEGTVIRGFTFRNLTDHGIVCERTAVTIENCVFRDSLGPNLRLDQVRATVRDSLFMDAEDPSGNYTSAISAVEAELDVVSCRFEGNTAEGAAVGAMGRRLTVTDCSFEGNVGGGRGGGLSARADETTVRNCEFLGNAGGEGSGAYLSGDSVTVQHCRFIGNVYSGNRSALYLYALAVTADSIHVSDCTVEDNETGGARFAGNAEVVQCTFNGHEDAGLVMTGDIVRASQVTCQNNGGPGLSVRGFDSALVEDADIRSNGIAENRGGVSASGHVVLDRCVIVNNMGENGGGASGDLELRNCIVRDNVAVQKGGGIYGRGVRILNSRIENNRAGGNGGAVSSSRIEASGCIFAGNVSAQGGGALDASISMNCTNSVFYDNAAEMYSGGAVFAASGQVALHNNIFWNNVAPRGPQIGLGPQARLTGTFNDAQGGRKAMWRPGGDQVDWNRSNLDADPMFVNPGEGDFRLRPGSPCIDAADNRAVQAFVAADPDGNLRFHDDPNTPDTGRGRGAIADMGAFEFDAPTTCSGNERLRARCSRGDGGNSVDVTLRGATPGARVTLQADGWANARVVAQANANGRAKASLAIEQPASRVSLIECGVEANVRCRP